MKIYVHDKKLKSQNVCKAQSKPSDILLNIYKYKCIYIYTYIYYLNSIGIVRSICMCFCNGRQCYGVEFEFVENIGKRYKFDYSSLRNHD